MLEYDMPITIRQRFLEDKEIHEENCVDGYITKVNIFTGVARQEYCPYCRRFNKAIYHD